MKKIIILNNVRSVYNVGSVFRTADGAGVDEIILIGLTPTPKDRFGRIRNDIAKVALGAEKTLPWRYEKNIDDVLIELKKKNYYIVGVEQNDKSVDYRKIQCKKDMVFLFGNERNGITKSVLSMCDVIAEIPMYGKKESLNISVSVGIILFSFLGK